MRLLLPTFFGVAAFFAGMLLLSHSCTAMRLGASSSSAPAGSGDPGPSSSSAFAENTDTSQVQSPFRSPMQSPLLTPMRSPLFTPKSSPEDSPPPPMRLSRLGLSPPRLDQNGRLLNDIDIDHYKEYLDFNEIQALKESKKPIKFSKFFRRLDREPKLPFYGNAPLFSIKTNPAVVARALKDHGSVGIVDRAKHEVRFFQLRGEGLFQSHPLEGTLPTILTLYKMDRRFHWAKKALHGQLDTMLREEPFDHLPHVLGKPVMLPSDSTPGQMFAAAKQGSGSFWLRHEDGYLLGVPSTINGFETPSEQDAAEVARVMSGFSADKRDYGDAFASLRWGQTLGWGQSLETMPRGQRKAPIVIEYPPAPQDEDANELAAPVRRVRQQMIDALRRHGRFHLNTKFRDQGSQWYKVKLVPDSSHPNAPMQVVIRNSKKPMKISIKEKGKEVLSFFKKLHLPS